MTTKKQYAEAIFRCAGLRAREIKGTATPRTTTELLALEVAMVRYERRHERSAVAVLRDLWGGAR